MRMLDLFAGRLGWSKAFLARGWDVTAIDLVEPRQIPSGCIFSPNDVLDLTLEHFDGYDFVCASPPCEQFALFGMKHFHPDPPFPHEAIRLFTHTLILCEKSGLPYVIENVRPAQRFVGKAVHHCGPYYLWGTGVPPLLPKGITKGNRQGSGGCAKKLSHEDLRRYRKQYEALQVSSRSKARKEMTAKWATIPPELAACVAEYAERLLEAS